MNKVEIIQERIDDKHTDSFWYDGLIAVGDTYELRVLGEIRFTGDEPKDDEELSKLYEDGSFSLNNWFEINEIDSEYSGGEAYGNYDEAIDALITLELKEGNK